jgi:pyruvate carboxylase
VTLEIRCAALGETNEDGERKVFFELNGQPRTIRVPDRRVAGTARRMPKADPANPDHVGAPMPGVVASVAAQAGARVRKGDLLLTIEAMKMETGLHADRDAVVAMVNVSPGAQIDAKDLLIVLDEV